jgi:hypothetical protein
VTATQRIAAARKSIRKQGPCAFCGGKYAAHRVIDAQIGRWVAGEALETIADDYDEDPDMMRARWAALLDLLNEATAKHEEPRKRRLPTSKNGAA